MVPEGKYIEVYCPRCGVKQPYGMDSCLTSFKEMRQCECGFRQILLAFSLAHVKPLDKDVI